MKDRILFSFPPLEKYNGLSDLEVYITDDCKISVGFEQFIYFNTLTEIKNHFNNLLDEFKKYMIKEKYKIRYDDDLVIKSYDFYIYKQYYASSDGFCYGIDCNSEILENSIIDAFIQFEKLVKNITKEIDSLVKD